MKIHIHLLHKQNKSTMKLTSTTVEVKATSILNTSITVKHGSRVTPDMIRSYASEYNNDLFPFDFKGNRIPFLVWVKIKYGWDFTPFFCERTMKFM